MLPNNDDELKSRLALTFMDGIGPKLGRILLAHFGSAAEIMKATPRELKQAGGMGEARARAIKDPAVWMRVEEELLFMERNQVRAVFLTDTDYPVRLKSCEDAPLLFYYKGVWPLADKKVVAVIGTRRNTDYGLRATEDLIDGLQGLEGLVVISGLAYGIDAIAHKRCLKMGIPTIGVVGHGLDKMYPAAHRQLAAEMMQTGGVLTEFPSGTNPDRNNFPVRNRVVAGLSDVTVVVESDEKGGAMITAYLATGYGRDVAAFPGRAYDSRSGGPNQLIRRNIASLITNAKDLLDTMNWDSSKPNAIQPQLFNELAEEEQAILHLLTDKQSVHADDLAIATGISNSKLAVFLLQLEMQHLIKSLPGKMYRIHKH